MTKCGICGTVTDQPFHTCKIPFNLISAEEKQKLINAAQHMDWTQVVLNQSEPCFHVCEDGHFCGRTRNWDGHEEDDLLHEFISLANLIESITPQR